MKKVIRMISAVLAAAAISMAPSFAQGHDSSNNNGGKDGWQQKIRVERIGFITAEVGLTSDEAEAFWPVYNKYQDERMASFKKSMDAYVALDKALEEGKPAKEINSLLQEYIDCGKVPYEIDSRYLPKFRSILSEEKVAKVYMAEEKFRRSQIQKLGNFGPRPHKK